MSKKEKKKKTERRTLWQVSDLLNLSRYWYLYYMFFESLYLSFAALWHVISRNINGISSVSICIGTAFTCAFSWTLWILTLLILAILSDCLVIKQVVCIYQELLSVLLQCASYTSRGDLFTGGVITHRAHRELKRIMRFVNKRQPFWQEPTHLPSSMVPFDKCVWVSVHLCLCALCVCRLWACLHNGRR